MVVLERRRGRLRGVTQRGDESESGIGDDETYQNGPTDDGQSRTCCVIKADTREVGEAGDR